MPRKRSPDRLKYLTLLNIANNMENIWFADYRNNYGGKERPLHVMGPFDYIPAVLLQELIVVMVHKRLLRTAYLDIMLDSRLTQLVFCGPQKVISKNAHAKLIASQCPNLTKLCIPYADGIGAATLSTLMRSLPKLRHLNMAGTKCNDQVLSVLGANCPDLEVLDINACNNVTDSGIFSLCLSFDDNHQKCNNLREIIMFCPMVTTKGVKVILENCPVIEYIGQMSVCSAMIELHHESVIDGRYQDSQTYKLRELSWIEHSHQVARDDMLANWNLVMGLCSSLQSVCLDVECDINGEWMQPICALNDIHELKFLVNDYRIYGLVPLLEACGHNLTSLDLCCHSLVNVSLRTIGLFCDNLIKLMVSLHGEGMDPIFKDVQQPRHGQNVFSNLQNLCLKYRNPSNTNPEFVMDVLPNCTRLHTIVLDKLDFVNDQMIQEIIKTNSLENLENLCFVKCNYLTVDAVDELLMVCPLKKVRLLHCNAITLQDFEHLQHNAQQSGWDIDMYWA